MKYFAPNFWCHSEYKIALYYLHDFRTSIPFKEKSSDHFKDAHKLKLLTNLVVTLT